MTAKEFFESQLITDSSSVIDKYAHIFNRSQLIRFAEAYHDSEVKKLNMPAVIKSLPEYNEIYTMLKLCQMNNSVNIGMMFKAMFYNVDAIKSCGFKGTNIANEIKIN